MQITENIQVAWSHKLDEKKTECILTVDDKVINSQSKCMHGDQFSYAVGRKMSLRNAMRASNLDKVTRTQIWVSIIHRGVKLYDGQRGVKLYDGQKK